MRIVSLSEAPAVTAERFVAVSLVETPSSSMRVIRLGPGHELPPHRHGSSDLLLLATEGTATLATADGDVLLPAGAVAVLSGDEELRAANHGTDDVTLVAFLAPPFPPRSA
jgi:quercetin dioxygenase-like cupin family protein